MNLYWVETADHHEDWFVVATSRRSAEVFHEQAEGYDKGDATAEKIIPIPKAKAVKKGWPDTSLLLELGADIREVDFTRVVKLIGRTFCEGLLESQIINATNMGEEIDGDPVFRTISWQI